MTKIFFSYSNNYANRIIMQLQSIANIKLLKLMYVYRLYGLQA